MIPTRIIGLIGRQRVASQRALTTLVRPRLESRSIAQYLNITDVWIHRPAVQIQAYAVKYNSTTSNKKSAKSRIDDLINNSKKKVFVFMKGVPEQPACGYSNAVIQILNAYGVDYDSFDVLEDDEIRQEIKVYSNWPTIPQVYVEKTFVGGCDIMIQMHQSDELEKLFGKGEPSTKN